MTNTNLITNIFPPKSLLCYEAQSIQERRVTFAHTYLYQKSLCISLVKKAVNKHNLFIKENLKLTSDDPLMIIQYKFNKFEEINVSL